MSTSSALQRLPAVVLTVEGNWLQAQGTLTCIAGQEDDGRRNLLRLPHALHGMHPCHVVHELGQWLALLLGHLLEDLCLDGSCTQHMLSGDTGEGLAAKLWPCHKVPSAWPMSGRVRRASSCEHRRTQLCMADVKSREKGEQPPT